MWYIFVRKAAEVVYSTRVILRHVMLSGQLDSCLRVKEVSEMEQICRDWIPRNEYTRPLEGQPYYRSSGLIYAVDRHDSRYAVGRIDYERFDEQNFQYVFTPKWSVIDALPASIFQGIPGLDMDLRLERYYRVNITPVFITERTPGEGREDLWELLESVGLDYYDRFEWLLRTNMRCGTDNLIVERLSAMNRLIRYSMGINRLLPEDLQPDDRVSIRDLSDLAGSGRGMQDVLLRILGSGARIYLESEDRLLSEEECSAMLKLLLVQRELDNKVQRKAQQTGIEEAKRAGKYKGRKRIEVDRHLLEQIAMEFKEGKVSEREAMERLGIGSRSTFYRRLRELEGLF